MAPGGGKDSQDAAHACKRQKRHQTEPSGGSVILIEDDSDDSDCVLTDSPTSVIDFRDPPAPSPAAEPENAPGRPAAQLQGSKCWRATVASPVTYRGAAAGGASETLQEVSEGAILSSRPTIGPTTATHSGSTGALVPVEAPPSSHVDGAAQTASGTLDDEPCPTLRSRQVEEADTAGPPSTAREEPSAAQRLRIALHRAAALMRRAARLCEERFIAAQAAGKDAPPLAELLVEASWGAALADEFPKPYFRTLCSFVRRERASPEAPVFPAPARVFHAYNTCPLSNVKVVVIGQDPYHGPGQAVGLSFSVPRGVRVPSSLANIYREIKDDVGGSIPTHGDLEKWAAQGVLLLNTVLTVRAHQANSHAKKGWEVFTDATIRVLAQKQSGLVFLLWGAHAQSKTRLIDEAKHHVLKAAHPSGLSANRGFFGCKHFSKCNAILEAAGKQPIDWQID